MCSCYVIPARTDFPGISPPSISLYMSIWYKNLFHPLSRDQSWAIETPALLYHDHREAAAKLSQRVLKGSRRHKKHRVTSTQWFLAFLLLKCKAACHHPFLLNYDAVLLWIVPGPCSDFVKSCYKNNTLFVASIFDYSSDLAYTHILSQFIFKNLWSFVHLLEEH